MLELQTITIPKTKKLLGSSKKVEKGVKKGVLTSVLYLSPSDASAAYGGGNLCPHATPGCIAACLGHSSGRLALSTSQNAQVWKSLFFLRERKAFLEQLKKEIQNLQNRAWDKLLLPAVRLNGTSDIPWERMRLADGDTLMDTFPHVRFYDYTKDPARAIRFALGSLPPNYHLTYSVSETNLSKVCAKRIINARGNVAVVFRTKSPEEFPATFLGAPVINGDETDVRFFDPPGTVCGLTAKGPLAIRDTSGFVQEI